MAAGFIRYMQIIELFPGERYKIKERLQGANYGSERYP